MEILHQLPPNYERIKEAGMNPSENAVYTYGENVYNPSGQELPLDVIHHEKVHIKQQGYDPEGWWENYLSDIPFRINQEVEAYAAQYEFMCGVYKDRNNRSRALHLFAQTLASETYGSVINIDEAVQMIRDKANVR